MLGGYGEQTVQPCASGNNRISMQSQLLVYGNLIYVWTSISEMRSCGPLFETTEALALT